MIVWDPPAIIELEPVTANCVAEPAVKVTDAVCVMRVAEDVEPRRARTVTDPAVVDVADTVATPDAFVVPVVALSAAVPDDTSK